MQGTIDKNLTYKNVLKSDINECSDIFSFEEYIKSVKKYGLKYTWENICSCTLNAESCSYLPPSIDDYGELYEIGLAIEDKNLKKNKGQYFTPDDVALVMSEWLEKSNGENVCDVGCGTGKLILTYLSYIGYEKARELISKGRLYLYDNDPLALKICKTAISVLYGLDIADKIHITVCDFLDKSVCLPDNCKCISNPPYSKISRILNKWGKSDVINESKEFYTAFMEKIMVQSESAVIITPYSFVSGGKFYSLRKQMNNYSGFIVVFDNVPGNIFCGKKHGIFNSNTSNSVRAAITVVNKKDKQKGFRLTPLIRFKQTERKKLLKCKVLEKFLSLKPQKVSENNTKFSKCHKELRGLFELWSNKSDKKLSDYSVNKGKYTLSMPNTCRYYTTASSKPMNRNGQISLTFDDEKIFNFVYCLINSSFAYWFWRIYDGGITYPKSLLMDLPMFCNLLSQDDYIFFNKIAKEMIKNEKKYIVRKNNVGVQENIKFPRKYRDIINSRIFKILGYQAEEKIFDIVHSNMALKVNLSD